MTTQNEIEKKIYECNKTLKKGISITPLKYDEKDPFKITGFGISFPSMFKLTFEEARDFEEELNCARRYIQLLLEIML